MQQATSGLRFVVCIGFAAAMVVPGCGLFRDFSDVPLEPKECETGVEEDCPCPDGGMGRQTCTEEGEFSECRCGDDATD